MADLNKQWTCTASNLRLVRLITHVHGMMHSPGKLYRVDATRERTDLFWQVTVSLVEAVTHVDGSELYDTLTEEEVLEWLN